MKSVAIVGAGPSGLAAANALLRHHSKAFKVALFDKQVRVGGMWAVRPGEQDGMLNPMMPTNTSRFTVTFTDLSWQSVDLRRDEAGDKGSTFVPMYPRAWQVGRYLETYARRNVPAECLQLGCEVRSAKRVLHDGRQQWRVTWKQRDSIHEQEQIFDYLMVASGFFAAPRPFGLLHSSDRTSSDDLPVKLVHSSRIRSLSHDVAPKDWDGRGNLLVIGGGMSGAEAATTLAFQISDMQHSPGAIAKPPWNPKVIHIVSRPFYAFPPYTPANEEEHPCSFLPSDLCSFALTRRPPGPIEAAWGRMTADKAQKSHQYLQLLYGDQRDLGASALVADDTSKPAYVAITAGGLYPEFVRSGLIVPVAGRLTALNDQLPSQGLHAALSATVTSNESDTTIDHISGVVLATGYSPLPALSFLSEDVLQDLEFDSNNHRLPIVLDRWQTRHPAVPILGFVGFYEGPFWGVAEMQARILADQWCGDELHSLRSTAKHLDDSLARLRDLQNAILAEEIDVPQYLNGDYVGLVEEMAAELGISRNDDGFCGRAGHACMARYCCATSDVEEATKTISDLHATLDLALKEGRYVQGAAFRGMHGSWQIRRDLNSASPDLPSGTFVGTASFHPRAPTDELYNAEYLYIESGNFVTTSGITMTATRRYVFRYSEITDRITSWFVKEDGMSVDYLFLDLELQSNKSAPQRNTWLATASHPCSPDFYNATYEWVFDRIAVPTFSVVYEVKGPKKDYKSTTWYKR